MAATAAAADATRAADAAVLPALAPPDDEDDEDEEARENERREPGRAALRHALSAVPVAALCADIDAAMLMLGIGVTDAKARRLQPLERAEEKKRFLCARTSTSTREAASAGQR